MTSYVQIECLDISMGPWWNLLLCFCLDSDVMCQVMSLKFLAQKAWDFSVHTRAPYIALGPPTIPFTIYSLHQVPVLSSEKCWFVWFEAAEDFEGLWGQGQRGLGQRRHHRVCRGPGPLPALPSQTALIALIWRIFEWARFVYFCVISSALCMAFWQFF